MQFARSISPPNVVFVHKHLCMALMWLLGLNSHLQTSPGHLALDHKQNVPWARDASCWERAQHLPPSSLKLQRSEAPFTLLSPTPTCSRIPSNFLVSLYFFSNTWSSHYGGNGQNSCFNKLSLRLLQQRLLKQLLKKTSVSFHFDVGFSPEKSRESKEIATLALQAWKIVLFPWLLLNCFSHALTLQPCPWVSLEWRVV